MIIMTGYKPIEWAELIARYMRDKYGWIVTAEDMQKQLKNHEFWGVYMDALAHYGMKQTAFSLGDVPEAWKNGHTVNIREKGKVSHYAWIEGKWEYWGASYDDAYKLGGDEG